MISLHRIRRIVPRWRPLKSLSSLLEEKPLKSGVLLPLEPQHQLELDDALERWKSNKTLGVALELLNSASYLQGRGEVDEASRIILLHEGASRAARAIAETPSDNGRVAGSSHPRSVLEIELARARLRRDPRNAFAALNLAHAYCAIGRWTKADRLILQALATGGTNRTVLRGAARYYLHIDEQERAHRLLAHASALLYDPWLLSGELALAEVIGRTSVNVKAARSLAESESLPAVHRSELNAAIGDLQIHRGDHKRARKSYLVALGSPTENVVAQAQFLETKGEFTSLPVGEAMRRLNEAPEARAMAALANGDWNEAQEQARNWLRYEPFSTRPVNLGFTAAHIGSQDMEAAALFARHGVLANPVNTIQHNNYAFALAQLGRVREAEKAFAACAVAIARNSGEASDLHIYKATAGLIAWRNHDLEGGRHGYREAADYFEKNNEKLRLAECLARWAVEELRAGDQAAAPKLLARAQVIAKSNERTLTHVLLDQVDSLVKKPVAALTSPTSTTTSVIISCGR
jgi:tetratricopeptide (TPR) repeat protein